MSDIGPGDWVECISVARHAPADWKPVNLVLGALYCVESVGWIDHNGGAAIRVVGVPYPRNSIARENGGFAVWRFRPIRDGQERIERKATRRSKTKEPA